MKREETTKQRPRALGRVLLGRKLKVQEAASRMCLDAEVSRACKAEVVGHPVKMQYFAYGPIWHRGREGNLYPDNEMVRVLLCL